MRRCWVHNWGQSFNERAFGTWARTGATIDARDCLFTQSGSLMSLGLWHTLVDIFSHVGNSVNMYGPLQIFNPDSYLPGVCRGFTADSGGKVTATNCYKNKSWIHVDNCDSFMSAQEAAGVVALLATRLPIAKTHLDVPLTELFRSVTGL